jgi:hypothetical protein
MKLSKQLIYILYSTKVFQSERPRIKANYLKILHWKHFVNYVPQIRFLVILISDITRILLRYKYLALYYTNSCTYKVRPRGFMLFFDDVPMVLPGPL